ncbi:MAG: BlaI/MecI/CopY family transcriptional regulator, partial [Acidobacteriota bacterium]|nr:BlaI/MecI/CopY family transcriptional regulator [Acidobacteriota bacterium]
YTTVHTELSRLVKKGFVRKPNRSDSVYEAALSREQFMNATVDSVLQGLMQSNRSAAIHGFVELVSGDDEAFDELKRALQERKRR